MLRSGWDGFGLGLDRNLCMDRFYRAPSVLITSDNNQAKISLSRWEANQLRRWQPNKQTNTAKQKSPISKKVAGLTEKIQNLQ